MDIRSLMEKVSKGRWAAAYVTLRDATIFPVITSALCSQPCRAHCQRTLLGDEAISVRDLEVACLRYAKDRRAQFYAIPPKDKRIAVVGAGMAGLSCALNLAQKRFPVTVFEKEDGWGGTLRAHPRFAEFDEDITLQFSAAEVEFRFGMVVNGPDELKDFDAVYVATGAGSDPFGLLESWDRDLFTTALPKVFAGGSLCGGTPMEDIAQGVEASKIIEGFLQTGKAARPHGDYDKTKRDRYLAHDAATSAPLVEASDPSGYAEEEARLEAARCLQCDCDACFVGCEMLSRFRKDPHMIAAQVHADMEVNPPFSVRTVTREVYSCNVCGYCRSVCPEGIDMGALLQFSRAARMSAGVHPAALQDFWLREMDFATSVGTFASAPKGKETCEYAFYPGCQLGASNPEHVLMSHEFLSETYDSGVFLGCCGAPAYWAGDGVRMRANIEDTRQRWNDMGKPTMIFACATCESLFSSFLTEIPGISLYELLASSKKIIPTSLFPQAAVFDPCAARGDDGMQSGVRELAGKAGVALEELAAPNRCCGFGGHMRTANPDLYDEISQHRAEASERPYIVYCANCKEVFASSGKQCAHILDVVFGLAPNLRQHSLQERLDNTIRVKNELMKRIQDVDFQPEPHPWDQLVVVISDELQKDLDSKLISAADLKEAIWLAESSGDKLVDESADMSVASMIKPVITYWVQYREPAPERYEVVSAYYHRMRIQRAE